SGHGEDTEPIGPGCTSAQTCVGALVVLIRENGHAPRRIRQGQTAMGEWGSKRRGKIQTAIGTDGCTSKGLPIKADREWERNSGATIVAMVTGVSHSRHDRVIGRSRGHIVIGAGRAGWRRCRCS